MTPPATASELRDDGIEAVCAERRDGGGDDSLALVGGEAVTAVLLHDGAVRGERVLDLGGPGREAGSAWRTVDEHHPHATRSDVGAGDAAAFASEFEVITAPAETVPTAAGS